VPSSSVRSLLVRIAALGALAGIAACAPRAGPLVGLPTARRLPPTSLPPGRRRVVFRWDYHERVFSARGQGVARIAPPDSVRLDFFLENGAAGGDVILIADSLAVPGQNEARRYLPPVPLLWAALGRITVSAADTTVRLDGDTLRADIGRDTTWRVTFGGEGPVRLRRIVHGRIEDDVERTDSTRVVYRQPRAGRTLVLTVLGRFEESAFDAAIWRP
jgi:hypothetical protein